MIRPLTENDSHRIAEIHREGLEGDFLPSLGIDFLTAFYEGIIGKLGVYGFVYTENKKVVGFVLGTKDSEKFFSQALRANFVKLAFLLLIQLIKNPRIVKNVLETFLYSKKEGASKAELVVIVVSNKSQGRGVGKKLVGALEQAFKKDKIKRYKLTVHSDKKAVGFYEHLGYSRISSFNLYGKMWFVYEKKIS